MAKNSFFVTGTDTGVGKTLVSAALLYAANTIGLSTLGLKPLAAGCELTPDGMRNQDALTLAKWASHSLSYKHINPVALEAAIAPHIAAEQEGKCLSAEQLAEFCRDVMVSDVDLCLVEGAGGWRVPLNARESMADVVKILNKPVILVIGLRLGCLNHAMLTVEAIVRDGVEVAAWVASELDAKMLAAAENLDTLKHLMPFPCLGKIPYMSDITPARAANSIDINRLLDIKET